MDIRILNRALRPLKDRIAMILAKGLLESLDDTSKMQLIKLSITDDVVLEGIEHVHEYGYTSNCPIDGGEIVVGSCGGNRAGTIALIVGNSKFRITGLKSGETCMYSKFGQTILLKDDGSIVATPKAGKPFTIDADLEVTGKATVAKDIEVSGAAKVTGIVSGTDFTTSALSFLTHVHVSAAPGSPTGPATSPPPPPAP